MKIYIHVKVNNIEPYKHTHYMNYLFPEMKQQNKKTLIVIGNGFDLASGIESSYNNFKEWLQKNGKHRLIGLMDTFF